MAGRDMTLDALLDFVRQSRGFDVTGYKRSSIERRVAKRMSEIGVERYEDYIDYLQLNPEEFAELGRKARELGFRHVESAPLVRSSYMAHRAVEHVESAADAAGDVR